MIWLLTTHTKNWFKCHQVTILLRNTTMWGLSNSGIDAVLWTQVARRISINPKAVNVDNLQDGPFCAADGQIPAPFGIHGPPHPNKRITIYHPIISDPLVQDFAYQQYHTYINMSSRECWAIPTTPSLETPIARPTSEYLSVRLPFQMVLPLWPEIEGCYSFK